MPGTSIRKKLMGLLLAATIIPIALSMVLSDYYIKDAVTRKSIRDNRTLLALGKTNILNYTDNINRISLAAYHSVNSPASLFAMIEKGASPHIDPQAFDLANRTTIYAHLLNMYQSLKEIHQIHLQIAGGHRLSYLLARGFFRGGTESGINWPAERLSDPKPFMEASHASGHYELDWNRKIPQADVVTLRRPIIRTPSDEIIGYLSIDVKTNELAAICRKLALSGQETLYLIDRGGRIVCAENAGPESAVLEAPWAASLLASSGESGTLKWKDKAFSGIVVYDTLRTPYMDWIVVKQLPYSYLYQNAQGIRAINTGILAFFLVVVVIATLFISFRFTKPIRRLIQHISQVQTGNLNVSVPVRSNDEIGILARRFNAMIATINDLINREYKLELANKTNQLKAMQAQINPHFLYNALQSIGTLALQSGAPKVYSLINAVAKMMRYNMSASETVVPLGAELKHAKAFLELQQQRFGEKLDVLYELDPASLDALVPKMLLQPILENVFKHGCEPQGGRMEIRLRTRIEADGRLSVTVKDNGAGMEPAKLDELRQRLFRTAHSGIWLDGREHIGLSNVWMRLKLYFGEAAEMAIESPPSGGFAVSLAIPVTHSGEVKP
jgi:two-component system sensor histidine kinase YesM